MMPPFDWTALVQTVFAAALPFLVQAIRNLKPTMPRILVWSLPPVLGAVIQWLGSLAAFPGFVGWKGFVAGLAAIALREAVSTLNEHGVNG